jgi:GTP cyclohydrolase I
MIEIEQNINNFLQLLGQNVEREGLKDTPKRVAKAWKELLTPKEFNYSTFDSNGYSQMIVVKNINYYTFCEHHMLPFFGKVSIGYIPDKKIVGISKLPRTVEYFSKRLNTQEYFTDNIAKTIQENLNPLGVGVLVSGRHLCQEMRGVKKIGETITTCLLGRFLNESDVRKEFYDNIKS